MLEDAIKDKTLTELNERPANFKAKNAVFWKKGNRVPFTFLAIALEAISKESDTIVITKILCNMFRTVIDTRPEDLVAVMYILSERIYANERIISKRNFPMVGFHTIRSAVEDSANYPELMNTLNSENDLSSLAKEMCKHIPYDVNNSSYEEALDFQWSLTVQDVYKLFKSFSLHYVHPKHSQYGISEVLTNSNAFEACYVIQLLSRIHQPGFHKINLDEQTLLTSLAHAVLYSVDKSSYPAYPAYVDHNLLPEKAAENVIKVYSIVPFYEHLVPNLLRNGVWKLLDECSVVPGISVRAMLPKQTMKSPLHIYEMFREKDFICQFKYPGQRVLIHYMENKLSVYGMFGDWITETEKRLYQLRGVKSTVTSFILDCQLVEYKTLDKKTAHEWSENALVTNPNNHHWLINIMDMKKVCVVASDILYCNGEALLRTPLKIRRKILQDSFEAKHGVFQFANTLETPNYAGITKFLDEAVKSHCPGLIFRTLTKDAMYEPGKINENWIELKTDYVEYIYPSLKLVPIAQLRHKDMRDDIAFLLACYDIDNRKFVTICTLGFEVPSSILKGRIESLESNQLKERKDDCSYLVPQTMYIHVIYEPSQVWEVTCECLYEYSEEHDHMEVDLTLDSEKDSEKIIKGYKLVCPRFVRVLEYEDVKRASSLDEVKEIYETSKGPYEMKTEKSNKVLL